MFVCRTYTCIYLCLSYIYICIYICQHHCIIFYWYCYHRYTWLPASRPSIQTGTLPAFSCTPARVTSILCPLLMSFTAVALRMTIQALTKGPTTARRRAAVLTVRAAITRVSWLPLSARVELRSQICG